MLFVKRRVPIISLVAAFLINVILGATGHASSALTTLATFDSSQYVLTPSSLVEGPDGNFYAAASSGGTALPFTAGTSGSIVQITPQGVVTTVHTFAAEDGAIPTGLVLGPDGNLYGTTQTGGLYDGGTLFKMTTAGVFSVVYAFPNGSSLMGMGPTQLTVGVDGNLYGMTEGGGTNECGALFRMTLAGVPTVLYSFPQIGGSTLPGAAPMAVDTSGNLYGIANEGLFSLQTGGSFAILHQFASGQGSAVGQGIVVGSDGSLYGPLDTGGNDTNNSVVAEVGSIYKLTGGVFSILAGNISSSSLIDGGDGYFYGVGNGGQGTCACGQIFKFNAAGTFISAYYFNGTTDGGPPTTPLIRGTDGYFYGATATTLYRFDSTAPAPPAITFTASPPGIVLGASTTLSWSVVGASSCVASNAWSGSVAATSGSSVVTPTAAGMFDYALTCSGTGGTTVSTIYLYVDGQANAHVSILPSTVGVGQTAVISISGSGMCVKSGAWSGSFSGSGSVTQPLSPTTSGSYVYTLTCTGTYGISTATASATLTVVPAPTLSISVSPTTVAPGAAATLTWSTTNAASCVAANAWSGSVATSGSQNVTPSTAGNYSYTLTCTGIGGAITNAATLAVAVPATGPTAIIAVSPSSITVGQSADLTWSSTNATSCTAQTAWSGSIGASGSATQSPTAAGTYEYTISCTGPGGTTNNSATLTVTAPALPTVTLSSNLSSITIGGNINLSWSSTNATSCSASGAWSGSEASAGSASLTPASTGTVTYTLQCIGPGGSASAKAAVAVAAAAVVETQPPPKSGGGTMEWAFLIGLGVLAAARTRTAPPA
jgi:uncharacterized repeat protein (TIGR03803 family)